MKQNNLGKDPVLWSLLRLAIPSMLAQLVSVLYGIVDRMYIGNIPGEGNLALAGVGVCAPMLTLISSCALLVGIGGAPLAAIRMGEKNQEGAAAILSNCFWMLLFLSGGLTCLFLLFKRDLLLLFGASAASLPYAQDYLTICVCGAAFSVLSVGLNQFIICQGRSAMAMSSVLIGAILNIALDPVFIFVFGMGVSGAALATVLSQLASFLFVFLFLRSSKAVLRLSFQALSGKIVRRVLTFGFSPFIICASDSVLVLTMNSVLQQYGGPQQGDILITTATIVQSYMQLVTMPLAGITGGTQPFLSYNYGAGDTGRVRQGFFRIIGLCVCFTTAMFLVSQTVSGLFVRLFTSDPTLSAMAVNGIRIYTLAIIPLGFQYGIVDGFTAMGIAKIAVTLSLGRKTLYLLSMILLPVWAGAFSVFYAEPIADAVCGTISTIVFALLFRRCLRIRDEMPKDQALYD